MKCFDKLGRLSTASRLQTGSHAMLIANLIMKLAGVFDAAPRGAIKFIVNIQDRRWLVPGLQSQLVRSLETT